MEILSAVILGMSYKLPSHGTASLKPHPKISQQFLSTFSFAEHAMQNYLRAGLTSLKTPTLYIGLGPAHYNQPQWFPWAAGLQLHQPETVHSRGMRGSEDRNLISYHCLKTKQNNLCSAHTSCQHSMPGTVYKQPFFSLSTIIQVHSSLFSYFQSPIPGLPNPYPSHQAIKKHF